jgi:hypothetical protein
LDRRGQMQERHVLADARWRNMAQPGQLAGNYSTVFSPAKRLPLLRTDWLNANQWLKAIAVAGEGSRNWQLACDSVYMNTFFSTTIERWRIDSIHFPCERNAPDSPWAGVGCSWSRNLHLKVFLPRIESFNEDSFAECQRGLKPIPASCDYTCMNTFFSTTIERWRIERFIPCERNASCFVVGRSSSPH